MQTREGEGLLQPAESPGKGAGQPPTAEREARHKRHRSRKRRVQPGFVLDCTSMNTVKMPEYNGLYDWHLVGHFEKSTFRQQLRKIGLINREGRIV